MKNYNTLLLWVTLFFVALKPLCAQITLSQTDIAPAGTQLIMQNHQYTGTAGSTGANQLWNFSSLSGGSLDTLNFVLPSQTPYAGSFPGSNLVIKETGNNFLFFNLSAAALSANGVYTSITPADSALPITLPPLSRFVPPLSYMRFPATYNSAFTSNSSIQITVGYSTTIPNPIGSGDIVVDSLRLITAIQINSLINGWGVLRLSANRQDPALRQRMITRNTVSIEVRTRVSTPLGTFPVWVPFPQNIPVNQQTTVLYWAKNKKYPLLQFDLDSAGTEVFGASSQFAVGTSIQKQIASAAIAIWPNPLSGTALNIGAGPACKLDLYAVSGALMYETSQAASTNQRRVDVPVLPAGIYIVRISGQGFLPQVSTLTIKNQTR